MKQLDASELQAMYRRCFGSPEGEIVLADLERRYQHRSSLGNLAGGGGWEAVLAREGERNVYLYIALMAARIGMEEEPDGGTSGKERQ